MKKLTHAFIGLALLTNVTLADDYVIPAGLTAILKDVKVTKLDTKRYLAPYSFLYGKTMRDLGFVITSYQLGFMDQLQEKLDSGDAGICTEGTEFEVIDTKKGCIHIVFEHKTLGKQDGWTTEDVIKGLEPVS